MSGRHLIEKAFGPIPAQPPPPPPVLSEPEQRGERRAEVHYPAQNVSFAIGYKTPGVASPDVYVLDVLSSILSEGESSRLHQALVYERRIALGAGAGFRTHLNPGLFEFYAEMRPGLTAAEGVAVMDSVIAALASQGPTERELQKARNQLEAGFIKGLKTNNGVGQQLGYFEHLWGDYKAMFRTIDRYHAITADDCRRVARKIFDAKQRTVAVLVPEKQDGAEGQP